MGLAVVGGMHPSVGIVRVETLSLRRRANFQAPRRTLCVDRVCRQALAEALCEFSSLPASPLAVFSVWERWCVERPENSVWN